VLATVASSARAERLPLQAYTTAEGLPHNEINKIVRDSRGFLWFCTGDGLSRFDGYSFTNYGTAEGLPHGRVTDFLETGTVNSGWAQMQGSSDLIQRVCRSLASFMRTIPLRHDQCSA
jgi:ligand-binding sensor domain-containing protein